MPTAALARPASLHLASCASHAEPEDRDTWSPDSTSSNGSESDEEAAEDKLSPDVARRSPETVPKRLAPLNTQVRSATFPPKSSPLAGGGVAGLARPRPRPRGLSPLSAVNGECIDRAPAGLPRSLPKSQPLARTLFNRPTQSAFGTGPTGLPKKTTKLIVPTKPFRTTFVLGLERDELQRKTVDETALSFD
ncbi:hypothetical protein Q8F55_006994 [Vanrija albida]|uniref:Uncharacterized protein n=1 Tax=Vanrija albida TaxID=181172 RepID=A0ABR3PYK4_9TREE